MKKYFLPVLLLSLIFSTPVTSQDIDDEIGFKYVKGNYLFDSGRYDEAIQIYNEVVDEDPSFKEVLVFRARAKYNLGAYKGAKKDGIRYIDLNGLNPEVCLVLGKAEFGMDNPEVALNYFDVSCMWNDENSEAFLFRGNVLFDFDDIESACADWDRARKLGSDLARQKMAVNCSMFVSDESKVQNYEKENKPYDDYKNEADESEEVLSVGERIDDVTEEENDNKDVKIISRDELVDHKESTKDTVILEEKVPEKKVEIIRPMDNSIEMLEVDDDLSIKLFAGIGNRKVKLIPEILILSDNSGEVVIDICIDQSGNVSKASLNRNESTISSAGLISLALRKSREFKFNRSRSQEQCGKLSFILN